MRGFIIEIKPVKTFDAKGERTFMLCVGNTCLSIKRGNSYPFYVWRDNRAQMVELDERRFERETEIPVVETYYGWEMLSSVNS